MYALSKSEIAVKINNISEKSIKRYVWWWDGYSKICLGVHMAHEYTNGVVYHEAGYGSL
jgi:hypothetical protein